MGGHGAGSWFRYGAKRKTGSCLRLDISYLRRGGFLASRTLRCLYWNREGEENATIGVITTPGSVRLLYEIQSAGQSQKVEDVIKLTRTPCNYGGMRDWFVCPGCRRRVRVL